VVKIGSSSLTAEGGLDRATEIVDSFWREGHRCVLVSSGAVAKGLPALGIDRAEADLTTMQVAAAVGQTKLLDDYAESFARHGRLSGQVLLTKDILANRSQYLNGRETLNRMLELDVVPIVNENDSVVTDELRFGDNDRLAAIVSHLVGASLLLMLTDTPGLYADDPRLNADAELIGAVKHTDELLDGLSGSGPLGSGGVATKVAAARMAAWSGIPSVIAGAGQDLSGILAGDEVVTWIDPHQSSLSARRLWIAFGLPASGTLAVDAGATRALAAQGTSLLPVGVVRVEGDFPNGSAVEIVDEDGRLVGKGLVRMGSDRLKEVIGLHSEAAGGDVAVHRDDLVVLI
jgi:glutamate 5-kinase